MLIAKQKLVDVQVLLELLVVLVVLPGTVWQIIVASTVKTIQTIKNTMQHNL